MKQWKIDIVDYMCKKADEVRVFNFRKICSELGVKHIKTQEVTEITREFLKRRPDWHAVRYSDYPAYYSLFCSLFFEDNDYYTGREEANREVKELNAE